MIEGLIPYLEIENKNGRTTKIDKGDILACTCANKESISIQFPFLSMVAMIPQLSSFISLFSTLHP